jgi:hypothetical protein
VRLLGGSIGLPETSAGALTRTPASVLSGDTPGSRNWLLRGSGWFLTLGSSVPTRGGPYRPFPEPFAITKPAAAAAPASDHRSTPGRLRALQTSRSRGLAPPASCRWAIWRRRARVVSVEVRLPGREKRTPCPAPPELAALHGKAMQSPVGHDHPTAAEQDIPNAGRLRLGLPSPTAWVCSSTVTTG